MAKVTRHAEKRTRSRLGLPKRAAGKNAERALRDGIRHKDVNGSLRRLVDALYFRNMAGNNIRIYNSFVYIFHDQTLITVFNLPRRYQQAAIKLQKERKNENNDGNMADKFAANGGVDT